MVMRAEMANIFQISAQRFSTSVKLFSTDVENRNLFTRVILRFIIIHSDECS